MPIIEHVKDIYDLQQVTIGIERYIRETGNEVQIIWGEEENMKRVFR